MNENVLGLKQLRKRPAKPLTLKITIPAKIVPLFLAVVDISQTQDQESLASLAVCQWISSAETIEVFDHVVTNLLRHPAKLV